VPTEPVPPPRVGRRSDPPAPRTSTTFLQVNTPRPTAAVLSTAWPVIVLALAISFLFATFFPELGALLLVAVPPAVLVAFAFAALKARGIRLTVTDEVVRVSNGKAGYACDRADVRSALLVSKLRRRALAPRTTDLFLLDGESRSVMMLSGRLWPAAVLEQVIDIVTPNDVQRLPGPESLVSLQTQFPRILKGPQ
jgi:hypothetical protein